jgi:hypothetical protein
LWRRGFARWLLARVTHEQAFPHERLALPEEALAVLVHLRPESHFIERAVQADLVFRALDEHDVAVARPTNALVADRFSRDLHDETQMENEGP